MSSPDQTFEDFQETFKLFNPKVSRHLKTVTPESLKQDELFHIATLKFDALVPNVSKRSATTEDNTIPRVHCSTNLAGCIAGYASLFGDVGSQFPGQKKSDTYKGGYYIYFVPFDYALRPNKELVYDVEVSDEHWLVTYNLETRTYKPAAIGRMVPNQMVVIPSAKGLIHLDIELFLEIPTNHQLALNKDTWVGGGYWKVRYHVATNSKTSFDPVVLLSYEAIGVSEFNSCKKERATMLSHEEKNNTSVKTW